MAFVYDLGVLSVSPIHSLFIFKEKMKANGWTVVSSGDGSAGNFSGVNGGDILTHWREQSGTVANSLTNRLAWFRLQAPDGGREFIIQIASNFGGLDDLNGIWYSARDGFTGGSPDASTPPTAVDEAKVGDGNWGNIGGGSASGGHRQIMDFIIGDADEDYAFFCGQRLFGNLNLYGGGMWLDVLDNAAPEDEDPAIVNCCGGDDVFNGIIFDGRENDTPNSGFGGDGAFAWKRSINSNGEDEMSRYFIGQICTSGDRSDRMISETNPWDGSINVVTPAVWLQTNLGNNIADVKGTSKFFAYMGAPRNLDMTADLKWLRVNRWMAVRWDGQTYPVI